MTPSQFSKPIQGDALRIDDWIGDVPDFEMVVEAPLDAQGYVRNPRVLSSKPAGAPSRDILAAVSTWRFCPQLAKSLGGRPYRIPIAGARQGGVNPAGAF